MAQPVVITPPSAVIQPGESVTLTASGAVYYQWAPPEGLSTTEGPVTVATPAVTTTYTCSGYAPGAESVFNGDFEQGNTGFTSAYTFTDNLYPESTYSVGSNAQDFHTDFVGTGHGGTGNFMVINGATNAGTNVWTEQITVSPNTYYAFSTWVCTVSAAGAAARLQFSINGEQLGEVFTAPSYTNEWLQFYELWYSGNTTEATITILNQNTSGSGNDFGLDDISFCELVLVGAPECVVSIESMTAMAAADQDELCDGASTMLHALPTGGIGNYTFSWTPANSLDDPTSQHPVATPPLGSTTYTCHIEDAYNALDVSVTVTVHPNETENTYETICANTSIDFYGQVVSLPGVYEHHLQTEYGCDKAIFLYLENYPANDTTLVDPSICVGETYIFHGTAYSQDGQTAYFDTIDSHGCLKVEKLVLSVGEYQMPPVLNQYECYAHGTTPSWTWDKTGVTYHENTVDEIILDDPAGGCPVKHRLNLMFHEEFYHEETKVACDEFYWPVTGETYHESQERIEKVFHNDFGDQQCDSIYVLHLEIRNYETNEFTIPEEESCDSLFWDPRGMAYTTTDSFDPADHVYKQSGTYQRTYQNQQGCDSIVTIHLDLDYTPNPTPIYPMDESNTAPHWVVTATEFQINTYDYYLWDVNPLWSWDTVYWSCENAPAWLLEPFGEKGRCCRLYVLNSVPDTVWLTASIGNRCASGQDRIERKYWFVSSFYGVEDHGTVTDFSVSPNPNNGLMTVAFENLTGYVDMKVYDMIGNLLDEIQYHSDLPNGSFQYDLQGRSDGMYFFVATGREGTLVKKVIVGR